MDNRFFGFYGSLDGYPGSCWFSTLPQRYMRDENASGNKMHTRLISDNLTEEELGNLSSEVITYKWEGE